MLVIKHPMIKLLNIHPCYTILNTTAMGGRGSYTRSSWQLRQCLRGRSGYGSVGVNSVLGAEEEWDRAAEEEEQG
jgi:hypothetical protein